jgi:hypothetical protein
MFARGRGLAVEREPRAATTFREARRAARELGFPVAVRPWPAQPNDGIVVNDLAGLVGYVERNHVAISAECPLILESAAVAQARARKPSVVTGTYEPAASTTTFYEVESKTA